MGWVGSPACIQTRWNVNKCTRYAHRWGHRYITTKQEQRDRDEIDGYIHTTYIPTYVVKETLVVRSESLDKAYRRETTYYQGF